MPLHHRPWCLLGSKIPQNSHRKLASEFDAALSLACFPKCLPDPSKRTWGQVGVGSRFRTRLGTALGAQNRTYVNDFLTFLGPYFASGVGTVFGGVVGPSLFSRLFFSAAHEKQDMRRLTHFPYENLFLQGARSRSRGHEAAKHTRKITLNIRQHPIAPLTCFSYIWGHSGPNAHDSPGHSKSHRTG